MDDAEEAVREVPGLLSGFRVKGVAWMRDQVLHEVYSIANAEGDRSPHPLTGKNVSRRHRDSISRKAHGWHRGAADAHRSPPPMPSVVALRSGANPADSRGASPLSRLSAPLQAIYSPTTSPEEEPQVCPHSTIRSSSRTAGRVGSSEWRCDTDPPDDVH